MYPPTLLLILQSCSFTVSLLLAFILWASQIHHSRTSPNYETSRWLLITSMLIFAVHYYLQMRFGFRARSAQLGALVNILFYSPVAYLISYASLRLLSTRKHKKIYIMVCTCSMALIVGCIIVGYAIYGSFNMPYALQAMAVVFFLTVLFLIVYPAKEIKRATEQVKNETGGDLHQFTLYMRTGTMLLYSLGVIVPLAIFSNTVLSIVGPFYLCILVFYVLSFIALGFNLSPVIEIIDEESEMVTPADDTTDDSNAEAATTILSEENKEQIAKVLNEWRKQGGYSQCDTNCTNLAQKLRIPKRQLVAYLLEQEGKTFRVWLSDLRIEEAKRMLIEDDNYKLESIAAACGFSHRNYLQNRFKAMTGLTPREWQEHHKAN